MFTTVIDGLKMQMSIFSFDAEKEPRMLIKPSKLVKIQ
ncbi:hypothetical protein J699_02835 [Acinetobacter sp. 1000160]|nr:hypothetical protein J522_3219 [Acinetobacter baumannii 146457]EYT16962.1 hypothetical protein J699_02835 [Acinetobacter sp. 1000160]